MASADYYSKISYLRRRLVLYQSGILFTLHSLRAFTLRPLRFK